MFTRSSYDGTTTTSPLHRIHQCTRSSALRRCFMMLPPEACYMNLLCSGRKLMMTLAGAL